MFKKISPFFFPIPVLLLVFGCFLLVVLQRGTFGALDQLFYDRIVSYSIKAGIGPSGSDEILYILITDETYESINKNYIPRRILARLNNILTRYGAKLVLYDLIFARQQSPQDDDLFYKSIENNEIIYLPAGFGLEENINQSTIDARMYHKEFHELNKGKPDRTGRKYLPDSLFLKNTRASGHVSAPADKDGVFRHFNLFIRDDEKLIPALSLIAFLDLLKVKTGHVKIDWGNEIVVPIDLNKRDLRIPIDITGKILLPFTNTFSNDFENISIHDFLRYDDQKQSGNIAELVENRIIFIGDISTGISDTGVTPLENRVPLVALHTVLMNSLLEQNFIREASRSETILAALLIMVLFYLISLRQGRIFLNFFALFLIVLLPLLAIVLHFIQYRMASMSLEVYVISSYLPLFLIREFAIFQKSQKIKTEHELLKKELQIASKIQQDILPLDIAPNHQYELQSKFMPATEVGGDFYDVIQAGENRLCFAIGDVSGKGVSAALYMSAVVSSFRSLVLDNISDDFDLKKQVVSLNRILCYQSSFKQKTMFVTASFIYIDCENKTMQYIRCGHEPLLIGQTEQYIELKPRGMMLGVMSGDTFSNSLEMFEKKLETEQTILLFTDGVTEATSAQNEFYSLERVKKNIQGSRQEARNLEETALFLLNDILDFTRDSRQYDDITFIFFKWDAK